ncbi:unnamed protein product [Leptosia nina]|uniref:Uncharacterized protein n=1 Tax=Leptosia nina TaxID=320188 RepID=A0AAV1JRU0_9NEOP
MLVLYELSSYSLFHCVRAIAMGLATSFGGCVGVRRVASRARSALRSPTHARPRGAGGAGAPLYPLPLVSQPSATVPSASIAPERRECLSSDVDL